MSNPNDDAHGVSARPDRFTHLDEHGSARMVDVGEKPVTRRVAVARGSLRATPETVRALQDQALAKGDALHVARLAGIMAAKRTDEWIPLCHTIGLDSLDVRFVLTPEQGRVWVEATAVEHSKTGVEMEALVAVQAAALTIYDMCKARDRTLIMEAAYLWRKEGGRSGDFTHPSPPLEWPEA